MDLLGPSPADAAILAALRKAFDDALGGALGGRREAVVLDAPNHRNAGDLLILQGTLDSLQRLGVRVRLLQDREVTSWQTLRHLPTRVAVLLHGGGNLGGLYPVHDQYRCRVLETVPDTSRVVVLPQSVSFPDLESRDATRRRYGRFPEAAYFIRDTQSLGRLTEAVPEVAASVHLVPDAAFGTTLSRGEPPSSDVLVLQRRDQESTGLDLADRARDLEVRHTDWPSFDQERPAFRALRRLTRLSAATEARPSLRGRHPATARVIHRVCEGVLSVPQRHLLHRHTADHVHVIEETLGQGRIVVTDRLHAHVGAALMGIPSVALDNVDGKVGALIGDWTGSLSTTHRAQSGAEAFGIARELLRQA
ncbi:polysaccharide pyruvyl transferase family protein [Intrasporangium calvum]|uniref:Polysaccharide pyruvyl transferase family protein n=1 Tax=Intrasporangium calvum TaxID=53358 RepID=A0ABT5GJ36_9MICO|nr:polysaccharide pyruvyl transferase family protein [Intrasporangium calvum]MDC5697696.1 polysaccharide pyruvyl transferase family protein [Intrasporangium calvum]